MAGTFSADLVKIDPVRLASIVRDGDGGLIRYMLSIGDEVKGEAQRRVGVYELPPAGPTRDRRPGTLRDSIVKRLRMSSSGPVVEVGSEDPIALLHHEGTVPHPIFPSRAPLLVFWSYKTNSVQRRTSVQHPGTQPNRYLTDALAVIGR